MSAVATSTERVHEDLVRLVHRGADVREFALGAARILARAVPFEGVCVLTMDPETLLPTGAIVEHGPPTAASAAQGDSNFAQTTSTRSARSHCRTAMRRLSHVTGGVLDRQRASPGDHGPERLRRRAARGAGRRPYDWGALALLRGSDRAPFSPADAALLAAVTRPLAEGLRRAVLLDHAATGPADGEDAAGVLVLAPNGSTTFTDEVAAAWIDELGGNGSVPPVVTAVASRARTVAAGPAHDGRIARARVRAASGRWLVVRASVLADEPGAQVAVTIEPARPHELAPLVADAYRLTEREREVTQLVARGLPTDAIAARLHLSSWTVQDHLKAIFEKVGVGARGELVARVFFQQRAPQL